MAEAITQTTHWSWPSLVIQTGSTCWRAEDGTFGASLGFRARGASRKDW